MKILKALSMMVLLVLFVTACTSSRITDTWKMPNVTAKNFNKIMVVGVIREADRAIRVQMENHLVNDLRDLGYNAYSAYTEFGPKSLDNLTENQMYDKLRKVGADAVITIVLLDKERERYYVPGRIVYSPYVIYYNRFWGYYTTVYNRIESPDYYSVSTKYFWESNLFDLSNNQLLYSVQTQSFDPSSSESLGHEYGKMIVQNMVKNNVLAKQTTKKPL